MSLEMLSTLIDPLILHLALTVLCFGVASGLVHIRKLELKNDQQRGALKWLIREFRESDPLVREYQQFESTAPDAPGEYEPPDIPAYARLAETKRRKERQMIEAANEAEVRQRINRGYTIPEPTIRYAPEPIKYNEPEATPRQQHPMYGGDPIAPSKAELRAGRDAAIRRQQAENMRKPKP